MDNIYDRMVVALGHKKIFKRRITKEEIIKILAEYPASQWLDLFAKIEGFLLIENKEIPYPQAFLVQNLFPQSTFRRIFGLSSTETACFALGPLNLIRKLAIAYGKSNHEDAEIPIPKVSISKILLASQDFHNDYDELTIKPGDLESFCQFVIRNGYLNGNLNASNLFIRAYQMYIVQAQKILYKPEKSFADLFSENVGINIGQTLAFSFALAHQFFQKKEVLLGQTTIIDPKTIFQNLIIDQKIVDSIIESLVIDFSKAREEVLKELEGADLSETPLGYNLGIFRKTPLIRLENGKLICSNLTCLLQKTTQNIIWLAKERIKNSLGKKGMENLANDLTNYRGRLFEGYIKDLCTIMAKKNPKIAFYYIPPEATSEHEEVADSMLVQNNKVLILEAKSRQFKEEFKYTGDLTKDSQFIEKLIKKGSEQIEIAARKIRSKKIDKLPLEPTEIERIYPVIVTYEPIPMHAKVQRLIRQRVREFGYLTDPIFAPLEIIDINDLEYIMVAADSHTLIDLLQEKSASGSHASETNFGNFLSSFLASHKVISNGWQKEQFDILKDEIFNPNLKFKQEPQGSENSNPPPISPPSNTL